MADGEPPVSGPAIERNRPPRHSRSRPGVAILALVVVVAGLLAVALTRPAPPEEDTDTTTSPTRSTSPSNAPVGPLGLAFDDPDARFATPTDTMLLFDDGTDGAVLVDVATGRRTTLTLPGQRPGERPFRIIDARGPRLVVGRGEIWAIAPGTDQPPQRLGTASMALPAAHPDRVWLVDESDDQTPPGVQRWRLVDLDGRVVHEAIADDGATAVRGVAGGLAVRRPSGKLARYEPATGRVTDLVGVPGARLAAVTGDRMIWCVPACEQLVLADASGAELARLGGDDVEAFDPAQVWVSPRGTHVAAVTRVTVGDGVDLRMRIYDLEARRLVDGRQVLLGQVHGDWDPTSREFYFRITSPDGQVHPVGDAIWRWTSDNDFEHIDIDLDHTAHGLLAQPRTWLADVMDRPHQAVTSP